MVPCIKCEVFYNFFKGDSITIRMRASELFELQLIGKVDVPTILDNAVASYESFKDANGKSWKVEIDKGTISRLFSEGTTWVRTGNFNVGGYIHPDDHPVMRFYDPESIESLNDDNSLFVFTGLFIIDLFERKMEVVISTDLTRQESFLRKVDVEFSLFLI